MTDVRTPATDPDKPVRPKRLEDIDIRALSDTSRIAAAMMRLLEEMHAGWHMGALDACSRCADQRARIEALR